MPRFSLACVLLLLTTASLAQSDGLRALQPDQIQWSQRRQSPDVFYAGIYGDPAKAGASPPSPRWPWP